MQPRSHGVPGLYTQGHVPAPGKQVFRWTAVIRPNSNRGPLGTEPKKGLSKDFAALLWPHLGTTAVVQASSYFLSVSYGNQSPFSSSWKALQDVWMGWVSSHPTIR